MSRFFNRDVLSGLESELRSGRPEPRAELVDNLVSRVVATPSRAPARRPRFAVAAVFSAVVLVGLAATGGVGYAGSSIKSAAKSSAHAVSSVVKNGKSGGNNNNGHNGNNNNGHNDPPWSHQYHHYVQVCYPFKHREKRRHGWVTVTDWRTITVKSNEYRRYTPPGYLGSCGHH